MNNEIERERSRKEKRREELIRLRDNAENEEEKEHYETLLMELLEQM